MMCSDETCDQPIAARGMCQHHYAKWHRATPPADRPWVPPNGKVARTCAVDGCNDKLGYAPYCKSHGRRMKLYGDPLGQPPERPRPKRAQGKLLDEMERPDYPWPDECVTWPHTRHPYGYGTIGAAGRHSGIVHRHLLWVHQGPPPTSRHEAAHTCGRGHEGCVNVLHLAWKTPTENHADKVGHGTTNRGERSATHKLTEDEVREIRALLAEGHSCRALGERYGMSRQGINCIASGRTWAWLE